MTSIENSGDFNNNNDSMSSLPQKTDSHGSSKLNKSKIPYRSILILSSAFVVFLVVLYIVYSNFPRLDESEKEHVKLPRNIADAKQLGNILRKYKEDNYFSVLIAFFSTYIFLQTFAIPGSIFLSILSGFLYPFPLALFFVCTCSSLGALLCYILSFFVGKKFVMKYLAEKICHWQNQVSNHKDQLLYYIIFLRITPFLPNWFINISSPIINVPLVTFVIGTFIGVAPPSCIYIQAGTTLNKLTTSSSVLSWNSILVLAIFAGISLLPIVFKNHLKPKIR